MRATCSSGASTSTTWSISVSARGFSLPGRWSRRGTYRSSTSTKSGLCKIQLGPPLPHLMQPAAPAAASSKTLRLSPTRATRNGRSPGLALLGRKCTLPPNSSKRTFRPWTIGVSLVSSLATASYCRCRFSRKNLPGVQPAPLGHIGSRLDSNLCMAHCVVESKQVTTTRGDQLWSIVSHALRFPALAIVQVNSNVAVNPEAAGVASDSRGSTT